jgi:succinyl-diaminopimelate desuccinylase
VSAVTTPAGTTTLSPAARLARDLVRIDTMNPPGNEARAAELVHEHLAAAGMAAKLQTLSKGRANLIAHLPGDDPHIPALLLSGHLDTVGPGAAPWRRDPLSGDIEGDRLHGRGASDMKGGVAAMTVAFERVAAAGPRRRPVTLALTAAEESGCQGAEILALPGPVGAILVGESTSGRMAVGHKGVMWLTLRAEGIAAHASTPELGRNAIVAMVEAIRAVARVEPGRLGERSDLGVPTLTATTIGGGTAHNIVPDRCAGSLDVRLTDTFTSYTALEVLRELVGDEIDLLVDLALPPVLTGADDPWIRELADMLGSTTRTTMNYFTDAAVLGPALGDPPVCLLGPGEPGLAHQTDEWCSIAAIDACVNTYEQIAEAWTRAKGNTTERATGSSV